MQQRRIERFLTDLMRFTRGAVGPGQRIAIDAKRIDVPVRGDRERKRWRYQHRPFLITLQLTPMKPTYRSKPLLMRLFAPKPKLRCAICSCVVGVGRSKEPIRCYYHRNF